MSKYRIRVECLDGSESLDEVYAAGMECEGFTFILKVSDGMNVTIHDVCLDDIANAIGRNDQLFAAGILGRAKRQAKEVLDKGKIGKMFGNLLNLDREE